MIYRANNVLSQTQIDKIFQIYRNSNNWIELDGVWRERHAPSSIGKFLLTIITEEEFKDIWKAIKPVLDKHTGSDVKLIYCRVLKYNSTCFIPNHVDSTSNLQQDSDLSVIIQLNAPDSYIGGAMIVSKQLIELQSGDAVFYTYDHEHEVKTIKQGVRYVLNLRCKKVK